jgi:hypothetical protein
MLLFLRIKLSGQRTVKNKKLKRERNEKPSLIRGLRAEAVGQLFCSKQGYEIII